MKVLMFSDPMGAMGKSQEEEYEQIKLDLESLLDISVEAEFNVPPWNLKNRSIPLYVFDFGGISFGCQDTVDGMLRELHEAVEEHPDTLFVIWSSFTWIRYEELMEMEFDGKAIHPNVVCFNGQNIEAILDWFKLPEPSPKTATAADDGMGNRP